MKCLVTGYKGFIGKNLVSRLKHKGYGIEILEKDNIEDFEKSSIIEDIIVSCDYIFHQGAITDTTCDDVNYMFYYNYLFTKHLVDQAVRHYKKIVFASSASIYGVNGYPTSIYAWSKKCAEDYGIQRLAENFVSLRYFNVYGPGEEHKEKMSSVACQAYGKSEFKLFPKQPTRDFVYVDDVVNANLVAMETKGGVYDVGTGVSRRFEDVLDLLGIYYSYHEESKIPGWYQYFTCANENKMLPDWRSDYDLEKGIEEYKNYLQMISLK